MLLHRGQYRSPVRLIHHIWFLKHSPPLSRCPIWIVLQQTAAHLIMMAIHRTCFVAVKTGAITGERNEIPQITLPCGRGSAWTSNAITDAMGSEFLRDALAWLDSRAIPQITLPCGRGSA